MPLGLVYDRPLSLEAVSAIIPLSGRCSSVVEQLFRKQQVTSSNLVIGSSLLNLMS